MISDKHKCIFIHIAKCAGTSIEHAFGVDVENYNAKENNFLFGWDDSNKLWLQHATPQQLIDLNYISEETWNTYYKFIVYRNSWDKAYSDYKWMKEVRNVYDKFSNYLNKRGKYKRILNDDSTSYYAGDHLNLQKSYFFLNGNRIIYNTEIKFDDLNKGLKKVINDLDLEANFFSIKLNQLNNKKRFHYSFFYNKKRERLVRNKFKEDIHFFDFKFEDKKSWIQKVMANFNYNK